MSNIFSGVQIYGEKWQVVDEVKLDAEDKAQFASAKVVSSDFGKSVCFYLTKGRGTQFIPMSSMGKQLPVGENVNLDDVTIQVLSRTGDKDILRVKID